MPSSVTLYTVLWLLNGLAGGPGWPAAALIMKAVSYHDPVIDIYIYIKPVVLFIILWLLDGLAGGPGWPAAALIMKAVSYHDPVIDIYISNQ